MDYNQTIQGRVDTLEIEKDERGFDFYRVGLQTPDGKTTTLHISDKLDVAEGDVLRGVYTRPIDYMPYKHGKAPCLSYVVNLGQTEIDSNKRSHYERGETLEGVVGRRINGIATRDLDYDVYALQLDDGSEIEVSSLSHQLKEGTRIKANVGLGLVSNQGVFGSLNYATNIGKIPQLEDIQIVQGRTYESVVDARALDGNLYSGDMNWVMIWQNEAYARISLALDGREATEGAVANEVFALSERAQERIKAQQIGEREKFFANRDGRPFIEIRDNQIPMTTHNIHDMMRQEVADRVANYDPAQNGGRVLEFMRQPPPPAPDYSNQRLYGPGTGFDL